MKMRIFNALWVAAFVFAGYCAVQAVMTVRNANIAAAAENNRPTRAGKAECTAFNVTSFQCAQYFAEPAKNSEGYVIMRSTFKRPTSWDNFLVRHENLTLVDVRQRPTADSNVEIDTIAYINDLFRPVSVTFNHKALKVVMDIYRYRNVLPSSTVSIQVMP